MKKSLLVSLSFLSVLVAGTLVVGCLLFMTTEGSRWLINQATELAQGSFKVGRIEGRLGGQLYLYDLELAFDGGRLHFDRLLFDWMPEKLLRREVSVSQLSVGQVTCLFEQVDNQAVSSSESENFAWPKLPDWLVAWRIDVERFSIDALNVFEGSESVWQASDFSFTFQMKGGVLQIADLAIFSHDHHFYGQIESALYIPSGNLKLSFEHSQAQKESLPGDKPVSLAGTVDAVFSPDGHRGRFEMSGSGPAWLPPKFSGEWSGQLDTLELSSLRGSWLGGEVAGSGTFDWSNAVLGKFTLRGVGLDSAQLDPQWPGTINLTADLDFEQIETEPEIRFIAVLDDSHLHGEPLHGEVSGVWTGQTLEQVSADLVGDGFTMAVDGNAGRPIAVVLDVSDLGRILPDGQGKLRGEGSFLLESYDWLVEFDAFGESLIYQEVAINNFILHLKRSTDAAGPSLLVRMSSDEISYQGNSLTQLEVDLTSIKQHYSLMVKAGGGALATAAGRLPLKPIDGRAVWNEQGLSSQLRFETVDFGWLNVDAVSVSPPGTEWPDQIDFAVSFGEVPWLKFAALPEHLDLAGSWLGQMHGSLEKGRNFSLTGHLESAAAHIAWTDADRGAVTMPVETLTVDWDWRKSELQGGLTFSLGERGKGEGEWKVPVAASWPLVLDQDQPFSLKIDASFDEGGLVSQFYPEVVQESSGLIAIQAAATGSLLQPELSGSLALTRWQGYIPIAGIQLQDLDLLAQLGGDSLKIDRLFVKSGPGHLSGKGSVQLDGWRPSAVRCELQGEEFRLIHLPELQLDIDPDLRLSGTTQDPVLSGTIRIPYFLASGRGVRNPVAVSPDVSIIDAQEPAGQSLPLNLQLDVTLTLGEQVLVDLFGLDARLGGELRLTGVDLKHFYGAGNIHVEEGHFSTYGVKLEIDRGRAVFAGGPLDNPVIDILALRKAGEVKAGVKILGTAKSPEVKLYSEPLLADTDILSYIVFGRPLGQSGGEIDPLMLAVGGLLSASDSAVLRNRLQSRLGIDTLDISSETGQTEDTVVRLGKYLTPDLYLSYGYSLFSQQSQLGLRYRLSESWEAESNIGVESGADLFYRLEFD